MFLSHWKSATVSVLIPEYLQHQKLEIEEKQENRLSTSGNDIDKNP